MSIITALIPSASLATLVAAFLYWSRKRAYLPNPLTGVSARRHLHQASRENRAFWEVFDQWCKTFGGVYSFTIFGKPVIVLSSPLAAWELLEKRGEIYSSRPRMVTAHEILSGSLRGTSSPYGEFWRKWRKVQYTGLNRRQALEYHEHQTLETTVFLRNLCDNEAEYKEHAVRYAASIALSISHGIRAKKADDNLISYQVNAIQEFLKAAAPGKYIVDYFPVLLRLPLHLQWFRRECDKIFRRDVEFYRSLLNGVRARMEAGVQKDCIAARALLSDDHGFSEVELAYTVSSAFGGGVQTVSASIIYIILAAIVCPGATQKAQEELDTVVGRGRMPTFADQAALPYLAAYIKEVQRLWPAVAAAPPRTVTQSDIYEGRCIPKDSMIYVNVYTMLRDPVLFPEPEIFRPERFLEGKDEELDSRLLDFTLPFGFGRRICPGMHVAANTLFIFAARLLWTFNVTPAPGKPIPDPAAYHSEGPLRIPDPFDFRLEPRYPDATKTLHLDALEADYRIQEWD